MLVSVIICTLNRAPLLRQCLSSLAVQTAQKKNYEVLIVDNGSKDDTENVSDSFVQRFSNFRFFQESKIGLSHARNLGFQSARGEYVAYFDDDCRVPEQWLEVAGEIIRTRKPAAFGGPYFAFYLSPKPVWFKDEYGSWELSKEARPLLLREYLTGLNMCIAKRLLENLGGFDPTLGMTGNHLGYAEESDFFQRLRIESSESEIYYDPRLYVYHLVRQDKMTLRWRFRHYYNLGQHWGRCSMDPNVLQMSSTAPELFKNAYRFARESIRGLFWRDRVTFPYYQNYLIEHSFNYLYDLGIRIGKRNAIRPISNSGRSGVVEK